MTEDDRKMTENKQNWVKKTSGFNAENKRSLKIKLGQPPSSCAVFLPFLLHLMRVNAKTRPLWTWSMDLFWYLNKTHFAPGKLFQFIISVIWVLMERCILFSIKYWHELGRQRGWKRGGDRGKVYKIPPIIKPCATCLEEGRVLASGTRVQRKKGINMVIWLNNMLPTISNWIRYSSFPAKVSQALLYTTLCQTGELLPANP